MTTISPFPLPQDDNSYLVAKAIEDFHVVHLPFFLAIGAILAICGAKTCRAAWQGDLRRTAKFFAASWIAPGLAFVIFHKFGPAQSLYWLMQVAFAVAVTLGSITAGCAAATATSDRRGALHFAGAAVLGIVTHWVLAAMEHNFISVFRPTECIRLFYLACLGILGRRILLEWRSQTTINTGLQRLAIGASILFLLTASTSYADLMAHSAVGSTQLNAAVQDARRKVRCLDSIRASLERDLATGERMLAEKALGGDLQAQVAATVEGDRRGLAQIKDTIAQAHQMAFTAEQLARRSRSLSPEQVTAVTSMLRDLIPEDRAGLSSIKHDNQAVSRMLAMMAEPTTRVE